MEVGTQFVLNIATTIVSFLDPWFLKAIKKQKLLYKKDYILFIDSTSIKAAPDAKKNQDHKEQ